MVIKHVPSKLILSVFLLIKDIIKNLLKKWMIGRMLNIIFDKYLQIILFIVCIVFIKIFKKHQDREVDKKLSRG